MMAGYKPTSWDLIQDPCFASLEDINLGGVGREIWTLVEKMHLWQCRKERGEAVEETLMHKEELKDLEVLLSI